MFLSFQICASVLVLLSIASAQVPHFGKCPTVPAQDSLDVAKYLGTWYEIKRFPNLFEGGNCVKANYSLKDDGSVEVRNRYIENGTEEVAIGEATIPDMNKTSILSVKFSKSAPPAEYKVVETDYSTYSLVFSCTSILGLVATENAWILSRTLTLDDSIVQRLQQKLVSYNIDISPFQVANQTGCPL